MVSAQPDPETMRVYVLGLLHKGPSWSEEADTARHALASRLLEQGELVGAGPVFEDPDLLGVLVFGADSVSVARTAADADPAIVNGIFILELHPWYAAKGIGAGLAAARAAKADSLPPLVRYQFGLLKRGSAWTPERTPEVEKLQQAHLENIGRLAAEGSLVMAGPLMDGGTLRGVFVFQVATLEDARRLAESDPSVRAGRLAIDLYNWQAPAGIVPAPDGH
jgi:uncharacterized protein YciI